MKTQGIAALPDLVLDRIFDHLDGMDMLALRAVDRAHRGEVRRAGRLHGRVTQMQDAYVDSRAPAASPSCIAAWESMRARWAFARSQPDTIGDAARRLNLRDSDWHCVDNRYLARTWPAWMQSILKDCTRPLFMLRERASPPDVRSLGPLTARQNVPFDVAYAEFVSREPEGVRRVPTLCLSTRCVSQADGTPPPADFEGARVTCLRATRDNFCFVQLDCLSKAGRLLQPASQDVLSADGPCRFLHHFEGFGGGDWLTAVTELVCDGTTLAPWKHAITGETSSFRVALTPRPPATHRLDDGSVATVDLDKRWSQR